MSGLHLVRSPTGLADSFKLQHSSPLDALARKTSVRRANAGSSEDAASYPPQDAAYDPQHVSTPPRHLSPDLHRLSSSSPLLHSRFARDSAATASSDNNSYLDSVRTSYRDSELQGRYYDSESLYSDTTTSPALRDSWRSSVTNDIRRPYLNNLDSPIVESSIVESSQKPPSDNPIPTVIVSSPAVEPRTAENEYRAGRAPVVQPFTSNFSRPVRPVSPAELPPTLPSHLQEQKWKVLERNARRSPVPSATSQRHPGTKQSYEECSTPVDSHSSTPSGSLLPGSAPDRLSSASLVSLYSNYSYYPYDTTSASPIEKQFPSSHDNSTKQITSDSRARDGHKGSHTEMSLSEANASTPQHHLQMGIQYHEANRLNESAICFEKSAKESGGCGQGMLMWGLTLRHGWGCEKNEKVGFKWLQKAAESAVGDLESVRGGGGLDSNAVKMELVLAIYEVGQCYFHGWGVAKDQKTAMSYYRVAARLGDPDAQSDLAFCLANGKGCKKDRKEAAKWYRAAVSQGQSDVGLAWIYKDKYQ